ncbi:hypothetical protein O9992_01940 [Vibrio lentus]|nr:hypothetical protein [Vibrio lentus]
MVSRTAGAACKANIDSSVDAAMLFQPIVAGAFTAVGLEFAILTDRANSKRCSLQSVSGLGGGYTYLLSHSVRNGCRAKQGMHRDCLCRSFEQV